jgi:hypothetical protein
MLVARSAPECRLYLELHPCSCGEIEFGARHQLRNGPDGVLVAVYEGRCTKCDLPRRFEFALDPQTPPLPPAFGDAEPSKIICPGQFALVADQEAASARLDPDPRPGANLARDRAVLARALAAQEEIGKFVPAGADAVPAAAFVSPEGQTLYVQDPGRFDADRLAAVTDSYRAALARYDS